MNCLVKKFAVLFLVLCGVSAKAYDCTGLVSVIQVSPVGVVSAGVGNMSWVYFCSVNEIYNNVQRYLFDNAGS